MNTSQILDNQSKEKAMDRYLMTFTKEIEPLLGKREVDKGVYINEGMLMSLISQIDCLAVQKNLLESMIDNFKHKEYLFGNLENQLICSKEENSILKENLKAEYEQKLKEKDEEIVNYQFIFNGFKEREELNEESIKGMQMEINKLTKSLDDSKSENAELNKISIIFILHSHQH